MDSEIELIPRGNNLAIRIHLSNPSDTPIRELKVACVPFVVGVESAPDVTRVANFGEFAMNMMPQGKCFSDTLIPCLNEAIVQELKTKIENGVIAVKAVAQYTDVFNQKLTESEEIRMGTGSQYVLSNMTITGYSHF
jgi:hypothetical protein